MRPVQRRIGKRAVPALALLSVLFALAPISRSSARALALPASDYPAGAQIAVLPSTNEQATQLMGAVHRSTFDQLHRVEGTGWLQGAIWYFKTGRGAAARHHLTTFGYGINLFHNKQEASHALADVKIKSRAYKVAHLPARMYFVSDARQTLDYVFFVYKSIEVETYYEYFATAPTHVSVSLNKAFRRQASHLAHLARVFYGLLHAPVTPTPTTAPTLTPTLAPTMTPTTVPTPVPSPSATVTPTVTATPLPSVTLAPSPTATATSPPTPTPTPTPAGFVVTARMGGISYRPGDQAIVQVLATENGKPEGGVDLTVVFSFPKNPQSCSATTDASGAASCGVIVPGLPAATQIQVSIGAIAPNGQSSTVLTSFTIQTAGSA